jgi:hypothetical protein
LNFVAWIRRCSSVFFVTIQGLRPSFEATNPAAGIYNVFSPGQTITFPVQVSDPDPVDVVRIINERKEYVGARNSVVF